MKLSADRNHPDYHDVVNFIDQLSVGGQILKNCVHIDTDLDEAQCVTQPITIEGDQVCTHVVKGRIKIIWKAQEKAQGMLQLGGDKLFLHLKKEWEEREMLRKQEQHPI